MIADSDELRESIKYSLVIGKISFVIQILLILCFSYKLMIVIRQYSNLLIKKFLQTNKKLLLCRKPVLHIRGHWFRLQLMTERMIILLNYFAVALPSSVFLCRNGKYPMQII